MELIQNATDAEVEVKKLKFETPNVDEVVDIAKLNCREFT